MGRIVNNHIEDKNQAFADLCCDIYQGEYVLVLGGDAILKSEFGGGNPQDYIIQEYINGIGENDRGTYWRQSQQEHKIRIRNMLKNEWQYDLEEISSDLVALLSAKCFRTVITTTFDGYLEALLRKIWSDKLRVMNIYDPKDTKAPYTESEYGITPPTLFYAFGKADSNYDYVFSENDAIKVISRWMGNYAPHNLINHLKTKKILAIGCKFDDWYFRFFWYCLRQDFEHLDGDVAISLEADKSEGDRKLAEYLTKINVGDKGNSKTFLKMLTSQICDPDKHVYDKYRTSLRSGGVFISYASEDFPIVCQIYSILSKAGIRVWFDNNELKGGDLYNTRIANAISECKVFIPILSMQTRMDIADNRWRYYKDKEWTAINDNKDCTILPVTLSGFDIRHHRDQIPENFLNGTSVNWATEGSHGILESINKILKRQ